MTSTVKLFLCIGLMVLWSFIAILQVNQSRRYRPDDSPMENAIARARRRAGTRPRGATAYGYEKVLPHPMARLFAWFSGLGCLALAGLIAHWWWHSPGREFSTGGIAFFSCGMFYSLLAFNMAVTRASLDDDSFALKTMFSAWCVQRSDVVGCRWLRQSHAGHDGWYVEQVLYDRAGGSYRVPNILKDRIPHASWVRQLENLDDVRPRSWPW